VKGETEKVKAKRSKVKREWLINPTCQLKPAVGAISSHFAKQSPAAVILSLAAQ